MEAKGAMLVECVGDFQVIVACYLVITALKAELEQN